MNNPSACVTASGQRSLAQWLSYLESIHPSAIDMGLERVSQVASKLNIDFSAATVITVGGTNGKGTTCRVMEQMLLAQGKSVGVYSSPHLLDYRERVRINGEVKAERLYCEAMEQVEQAREDISLTYFEFGTLAAMQMLQQARLDAVILEVGLGGRLDATNIVDPNLAILTTIGLDHQDWLGDTRELIATEKAGIMRSGIPVVIGEPEPPANLAQLVVQYRAHARWASVDFAYSKGEYSWQWQGRETQLHDLPLPKVPMQNASTALAALECLGWLPDPDTLREVLAIASMPGRQQQISEQPRVILDVAHNPQATHAMAHWLKDYQYARLHIVVGMLKDKALRETLSELVEFPAHWYLASTQGPRGCDAHTLQQVLPAAGVTGSQNYPCVLQAYQAARDCADKNDLILVFGSFLTVADVLAFHSGSSTQKE